MIATRSQSISTSERMCVFMKIGLALGVEAQDQVADLLAADRVEAAHRLVEEDAPSGRAPAPGRCRCAGACPSSRCGAARPPACARPTRSSSSSDARARAAPPGRRRAARRSAGSRGRSGSRRSTGSRAGSRPRAGTPSRRTSWPRIEASPRVARIRPEQDLERGGLARAVRPDEAEDLAAPHLERDAVQHALLAQRRSPAGSP